MDLYESVASARWAEELLAPHLPPCRAGQLLRGRPTRPGRRRAGQGRVTRVPPEHLLDPAALADAVLSAPPPQP